MNIIKRIFYFFGIINRINSVDKEKSMGLKPIITKEINTYTTPQKYPIILKSNNKNTVEFEILGIRNDKGVLEDFFFDFLKRSFLNKVYNSISIKIGQREITPDIALIDYERNIFIDIEIDEPYTIENGSLKPIHLISSDDNRNQLLLNNGWNVIRFAEKQIALHPDGCVDLINHFIKGDLICEINDIPCWTFEDAQIMISDKERDKYLPIEFQDNGRTKSAFNYRSFKITSISYTGLRNQTNHIILNFEDNEPSQCWIPKEIFLEKLKSSKMWEIILKYYVEIDNRLLFHIFIPFLYNNGWFLNGIGKINHEYFNIDPYYKCELYCSDSVLNKFELYLKTNIERFFLKLEKKNYKKNRTTFKRCHIIIKCPNCSVLYKKDEVLSEDLYEIKPWLNEYFNHEVPLISSWSDGYSKDFNMGKSLVMKCNNCSSYFWIKNVEAIYEIPYSESRNNILLKDAQRLDSLNIEAFSEVLNKGFCDTIEKELYLRIKLWWAINNLFRDEYFFKINYQNRHIVNNGNYSFEEKIKKAFEKYKDIFETNLFKLLELELVESTVIKAEIYRELGLFDKTLSLLENVPENEKYFSDKLKEQVSLKNKNVFI